MNESSPDLFNTSIDAGKASKLPDSFPQENFDLEGCQR